MELRDIKQRFLVFRNGIIADTFRSAGDPHTLIFGLQLPQLSMIAKEVPAHDAHSLAGQLWADIKCRESRLLACYLFDTESLTPEMTMELISSLKTREEADILAFKLLKYLSYADTLPDRIRQYAQTNSGQEANTVISYCADALDRNLKC